VGAIKDDAAWEAAFDFVIRNEGTALSENHNDPGGTTKFGISQKQYPNLDIKSLTLEQAKEIYYSDYWIPSRAGLINNIPIACKYFDFYVNAGPDDAGIVLQQAINFFIPNKVREDGLVGRKTIEALNELLSARPKHTLHFLLAYAARQWDKYYRLVSARSQLSAFAFGWTARAFRIPIGLTEPNSNP
jgi:lysozyme family protein